VDQTDPPDGGPPPSKREERRAVELRGFIVRESGEVIDIRVIDLSYSGCAIETVAPLVPDERVKLSVLGRGNVTAKVRWYEGRKAGLLFFSEQAAETERPPRTSIAVEAFLRRAGKPSYRVATTDLSAAGCKCEFVDRPEMGETVWIKFGSLQALEAKVSWIAGFNAGLNFCTPIHPAVFEMLVQQLGA
jgi:hypothetical protein